MKKYIPNLTKPILCTVLWLISAALLVTFIVVPLESFPKGSIKDTDLVIKVFGISFFSISTCSRLITAIAVLTKSIKLTKRIRYVHNTLNDDNALFFHGTMELDGDNQFDDGRQINELFWLFCFGTVGLFILKTHIAKRNIERNKRIFLLYKDGLYIFEVESTNSLLCKRGSIKNPTITTDFMNVIMRFRSKKISHIERDVILTISIKKSEITNNELKHRLEDLFEKS